MEKKSSDRIYHRQPQTALFLQRQMNIHPDVRVFFFPRRACGWSFQSTLDLITADYPS
jgi:hypothetical protein